MGIWDTGLYSNDTTADIRDTYIECLRNNMNDEEAYDTTFKEYSELIGTDEEALFWFAMADIQWRTGRLLPTVKLNALKFMDQQHEVYCDELDNTKKQPWDEVLRKLSMRLSLEMPQKKEISLLQIFECNPWNIGDIYAYRFHSKKSKEFNVYGKYIAIQKIGEACSYDDKMFSVIQVYNRIFSSCPTLADIADVSVLPLVYPPNVNGTPKCTAEYVPSFEWFTKAIMILDKPSDYPQKHLFCVGNLPLQYREYQGNECQDMYWGARTMEEWIIDYYIEWHKNVIGT